MTSFIYDLTQFTRRRWNNLNIWTRRTTAGLSCQWMVTVVHLFQVVRHRRIDADADGAASRKARRTALPATSREKMVRISSFLQPSLLQLVQVNRPNTTLTTNKQTQKNRKFSSCARPMKRFLTANQLESALFCLKIFNFLYERLELSNWTQKTSDNSFNGLSNGI